MISKVKVRQELALYEQKIKEERLKVENEINRMNGIFDTNDTEPIWKSSAKYSALRARYSTLTEVLWGIQDIRCGEMLNDN